MYYVYILVSKSGNKTYTGCTSDISRRIIEHNEGKVFSSRPFLPYELLHSEGFASLIQARRQERFYKSTTGRRALKVLIERWKVNRRILESPPLPLE